MNHDIDIKEATRDVILAFRLTGVGKFRLRMRLATQLLKLAAWVMPVNTQIEIIND